MQVVVKEGAPGQGGRPGAADVGLPDHGLAVVGGVGVGGGAQLWRWGQALHVAGFPLQGPGDSHEGKGREQAGEPSQAPLLPIDLAPGQLRLAQVLSFLRFCLFFFFWQC